MPPAKNKRDSPELDVRNVGNSLSTAFAQLQAQLGVLQTVPNEEVWMVMPKGTTLQSSLHKAEDGSTNVKKGLNHSNIFSLDGVREAVGSHKEQVSIIILVFLSYVILT